jgi:hypothetical protein
MRLGTLGVWAARLRNRDRGQIRVVASALEEFGYGAAWVPGGAGGELLGDVDAALGATQRIAVATGVLNRLVDGVVVWGDTEAVVGHTQQHLDARADHVCVQVFTANRSDVPVDRWREPAAELRERVVARRRAAVAPDSSTPDGSRPES